MFERMRRQFDQAARSWETEAEAWGDLGRGAAGVDLADRGDEYVVTADVPGFDRDEIDLRLVDGQLQITAEHERASDEREGEAADEGTLIRRERRRRTMRERVRLPESVDEEGITASLANGVLTVTVPKAEPAEGAGRPIEIE